MQEDALKEEAADAKDNEPMHGEDPNQQFSQNHSFNQLEDEFMSMESASFQDDEEDSQGPGAHTPTKDQEQDPSVDPAEKMQMLKANPKISKNKVADGEVLPTYLKGCKNTVKKSDHNNKACVEESKSHQGDDVDVDDEFNSNLLIGGSHYSRKNFGTQIME